MLRLITDINGLAFASYDDANKISTLASGSVSYDADGNMTGLTATGVGPATYTFEHRSKLASEVVGSNTQSYLYNTFGLRAVRTSPGTRFYIFNGDQLLGEVSTETTPEVAYTWGPDGLISLITLITGAARCHK